MKMKKIAVLLLVFLPIISFSQDQITYKSGGRVFNYNNQKLSSNEVRSLMENSSDALKLFNAGKSKQTIGNILLWGGTSTLIGKFIYNATQNKTSTQLVGYGAFGQPIVVNTSKTYSNTLLFVSAGIILIAIPIKIGFSKKIKKAVDLINEDLKNPKTGFNLESTNFISNSNGVGFSFTF